MTVRARKTVNILNYLQNIHIISFEFENLNNEYTTVSTEIEITLHPQAPILRRLSKVKKTVKAALAASIMFIWWAV